MQDSLFPEDANATITQRSTPDRQPVARDQDEADKTSGIECPVCGSGTRVSRTLNYVSFIVRERICRKKTCRHFFKTTETIDADYRTD